jgi:RluA family pseudouridine synthase
VQAGENIRIKTSQRWREVLERSPIAPAEILYEDRAVLVIDKPTGLPVHRGQGHDHNLQTRVQNFLSLRRERFRVAPVHRLDAGTSGAIVFGKGKQATGQMGRIMMAGTMSKIYLALVEGVVPTAGMLNTPVLAKGRFKKALTRYRPLACNASQTLLELELATGRRHQIRQQLSSAGWPILGDPRYPGRPGAQARRLMLHCWRLVFESPDSGLGVTVDSRLPEDFVAELTALEFPRTAVSG